MSKPTTYHQHENGSVFPDSIRVSDNTHPVAVVDVRENSEDMKRFIGLLAEALPFNFTNDDRATIYRTFTRYAAGESAEPPVITFQPGQRVRNKKHPTHEYTVGSEGSYFSHFANQAWERGGAFTSERYELVDGGDDEQ